MGHILDCLPEGVYVTSETHEIVYWNPAAERITGYSAEEVVGTYCHDNVLAHTDFYGRKLCFHCCPVERCLRDDSDERTAEVLVKRKDGTRVQVYVKTARVIEEGSPFGISAFAPIASVAGKRLTDQIDSLVDLATYDMLSGLLCRRFFDSSLDEHYFRCVGGGQSYGVLFLDIDDFKRVNTRLGHQGGDEAIRFVGRCLRAAARRDDVTARYGGDEFTVICDAHLPEDLRSYGERLVEAVQAMSEAWVFADKLRLTVSVGGAVATKEDASARTALQRADAAMFAAKRVGGARFVNWSDIAELRCGGA